MSFGIKGTKPATLVPMTKQITASSAGSSLGQDRTQKPKLKTPHVNVSQFAKPKQDPIEMMYESKQEPKMKTQPLSQNKHFASQDILPQTNKKQTSQDMIPQNSKKHTRNTIAPNPYLSGISKPLNADLQPLRKEQHNSSQGSIISATQIYFAG